MFMHTSERNALIATAAIAAVIVGVSVIHQRKQKKVLAEFEESIASIGKIKLSPAASFAAHGGVVELAKFRAAKAKKTAAKKTPTKKPATRKAR